MDSATNAQNDEGCDWDVDSATNAQNDVLVSVNSYVTGYICTVTPFDALWKHKNFFLTLKLKKCTLFLSCGKARVENMLRTFAAEYYYYYCLTWQ